MAVQPFNIDIQDSVLDDLKSRLERTRWPDELPGTDWDYGSNLDYVKELVEYWRTKFDWRAQEKLINSFSHFKTEVDGLDIHFIHEKGKGPNPIPLVVTHGWPGTFFEMHKIIPLLSDPASHGGDPADAFDVVVPSMPGYGFSGHPTERGLDVLAVGDLWAKLMSENLSYQRFGAQGGDWGASVTAKLGLSHADKVIGIHSTSVTRPTPYLGPGSRELSEAENSLLQQRRDWQTAEGGYAHIQGTKPQTLGYGLNDSPAGLASGELGVFLLAACGLLMMPMLSAIGIIPITVLSVQAGLMPQLVAEGVNPLPIAVALVIGFSLAMMLSPFGPSVMLLSRFGQISRWVVAFRWNGLFALIALPVLLVLTALVAWLAPALT